MTPLPDCLPRLLLVGLFVGCSLAATTFNPGYDSDTILRNPFMGWQTHSYRDIPLANHSTVYCRAGGSCLMSNYGSSNDDVSSFPDVVPSELKGFFEMLNWNLLNPSRGTYDFSSIDTVIRCNAGRGTYGHLRMRNLVSSSDMPCIPPYLDGTMTVSISADYWWSHDDDWGTDEINYHECRFLEEWGNLVTALSEHLSDVHSINLIDIGSVGTYGEWDTSKFSDQRMASSQHVDANKPHIIVSLDTIRRITEMFTGGSGWARCLDRKSGKLKDVFYSYPGFPNQHLIMNQGRLQNVRIAMERGAGWRADGIGTVHSDESMWLSGYPAVIADRWKRVPNVGEFSGDVDFAAQLNENICFAKYIHLSSVHDNHGDVPVDWETTYYDYFRLLGYRISLTSAVLDDSVPAGGTLAATLTFRNFGTAPAYKQYPLVLYVVPQGQNSPSYCQKFLEVDIREILPDDVPVSSIPIDFSSCTVVPAESVDFDLQIDVPANVDSGTYDLLFAFLDDVHSQRRIEFANVDKDSQGRYLVGSFQVTGGSGGISGLVCGNDVESSNPLPIYRSERPSVMPIEEHAMREFILATQDGWVERWGPVEEDEKTRFLPRDYAESYIQFDFSDFSPSDERLLSLCLYLQLWQSANDPGLVDVSVTFDSWTPFEQTWATRLSQNPGVVFLGSFDVNRVQQQSFTISRSHWNLIVGKPEVTFIMNSTTEGARISFASMRHEGGAFSPYVVVERMYAPDLTSVVAIAVGVSVGLLIFIVLAGVVVMIVCCACKKKKTKKTEVNAPVASEMTTYEQ